MVGCIATFIGILSINHPVLSPIQKLFVTKLDGYLDTLQEANVAWYDDFNGGFVPATPVEDVAMTVVAGKIPADLDGVYLRVGPNVAHWPPKKRTHVFDGDGFVHSVRISEGKAIYHANYIDTPRYQYEKENGEWFMRLGELHGWSGLTKILGTVPIRHRLSGIYDKHASTANTAIGLTPDNKVWALNEAGLPFRLRVSKEGKIESMGYDDCGQSLDLQVSAHPKYDYVTKETFFHGKDINTQKFFVGRIKDGKLVEQTDLPVGLGFQHDMFITKDYVVIIDGSVRFNVTNIPKKKPLWDFDTSHNLRFGVYKRATNNLTADNFEWIEAPFAAEIVHTLYGTNNDDVIELWSPLGYYQEGQVDGILGGLGPLHMRVTYIDVGKKIVRVDEIEGGGLSNEFGRVRDNFVGSNAARYGFSGLQTGNGFDFGGILKWDMQEKKRVGTINFPDGAVGGEPVFVPKTGSSGCDQGYISMFLWNTKTQKSTFVLYDGETFSNTPVAEIEVPRPVPLGFHGWWLSDQEIQQQLGVK